MNIKNVEVIVMVYEYDQSKKIATLVKMPKIKGVAAKRIIKDKAPKTFLKTVMNMQLKVTRA